MVAISITVIAQAALVAASVVQVHAGALNQLKWVHRRAASSLWVYKQKEAHPTYREDEYETYQIFRARYMAIGCPTQHGTRFFDSCCRARRNNETDADYPTACGVTKAIAVPDAKAQVIEAEAYLEAAATSNHSTEQKAFGGAANVTVLLDVAADNETLADALPQSAIRASESLETGRTATRTTRTFGRSSSQTPTASPTSTTTTGEPTPRPAPSEDDRAAAEASSRREEAAASSRSAEAAAAAARASASAEARREADQEAQREAERASRSSASAAAQQTERPSKGGGNSGGGLFSNIVGSLQTGHATFYYQMGAFGACEQKRGDGEKIVAIAAGFVGGVVKPFCGRNVRIVNKDNGKTVDAEVMDLCPGCGPTSLDLSVGAFDAIGAQATGVLNIEWAFLD